ncbi:MAG: futalosine hydrolase [Planctomycetes bacterium]|nr:futalosine hydrolase [Planctomycetota bacterium]
MSGPRPSYGGVSVDDFVVVCASPLEDFSTDDLRVVTLGVGKTAAAMQLTGLLRGAPEARAVLLFGVAGAFPDRHRTNPAPVRRGGICVVGSDRFGDEGVETPAGFQDLQALRIGDVGPFPANPRMAQQAASALDVPIVRGVTVSTCSGTEAASLRMWKRCSADIETMEGAAVAYVCRQFELPLLHVRAISNWTGDRDRGDWNLGIAVDAVQQAVRRLARGGP